MKRGVQVLVTVVAVPAAAAFLLGCPKKVATTAPAPETRVSEKVVSTRPGPSTGGGDLSGSGAASRQSEEAKVAQLLASRGEDIPIKEAPTVAFVEPAAEDKKVLTSIYFDYDKSNIRPEFQPTLEGIALLVHDLAEAMRGESGRYFPVFKVDGGACADDLLMQLQADILGVPVVRPKMVETTAFGAAFLAGLATGVWKDREAIRRVWRQDRRFAPKMAAEARGELLGRWKRAIEAA